MLKISGEASAFYNPNSSTAKDLNSIAASLSKKDPTLWGEAASAEAAIRMNWIDLPDASHELLPQLDALSAWARATGLSNFILSGMGGSSLAPEVMAKTFQKKLTVLDSTDSSQIALATPANLKESLVIVGSKSGSTIETASQKLYFEQAFQAAGLDPKEHFVIVTDPGSPLDLSARSAGYRVINADPNVGGRFSALSAFGLVPAALLGIDVSVLLDDALAAAKTFNEQDSVAIKVATLIFEMSEQNFALVDAGSNVPGIGDWIEQLVAESTGKDQKGRLPIVIESAQSAIGGKALIIGFAEQSSQLNIVGTLGEQFILWEWVTALLCRALKVDPFNQPNVTEAKDRTGKLLADWTASGVPKKAPDFETDNLEFYGALQGSNPSDLLSEFLQLKPEYFAVMAYLNRESDVKISKARELLAIKSGCGVTFGWGPRFLHSTGQFHKGGAHNGAFLQITGESELDLEIPGKEFTFNTLLMAQALGDGQALESRNLPLLRIHLKNRGKGITELLSVIAEL